MDKIIDIKKKLEARYKDSSELFPDFTSAKEIEVIPSPSAIVNAVTGLGGFPRGRVTEIHGPYSSGKTTIATEICVAAQRNDPEAAVIFVDYEHAFDATYGHRLGLDLNPERFIFVQPEYFEQGARVIHEFVESDLVDLICIDSAAAMTPKLEMEGEWDKDGGSIKGLQASLMARFLERITKKIPRGRKPPLIILNQTRAFISIGGRPMRNAPKEVPAGGNALKFYSSIRLALEIINPEGDELRGTKGTDQLYTQNRVRVTCIKNKLAPPWIRGTLVLEYGKGINNLVSIAELAEAKLGIMSGAGYFKYDGDTPETSFSCRGREAFQEYLASSPGALSEIEKKVLDRIKQEHAALLGIDRIEVKGKAKEIEGTVLVLDETEPEGMPLEDE